MKRKIVVTHMKWDFRMGTDLVCRFLGHPDAINRPPVYLEEVYAALSSKHDSYGKMRFSFRANPDYARIDSKAMDHLNECFQNLRRGKSTICHALTIPAAPTWGWYGEFDLSFWKVPGENFTHTAMNLLFEVLKVLRLSNLPWNKLPIPLVLSERYTEEVGGRRVEAGTILADRFNAVFEKELLK